MPSDKKSKKKKDRKREADDSSERDSKKTRLDASERITSADYFTKNAPFTRWLRKKKGVYFDQLSAEKSRKLFEDFIAKWNNNSLSSKYYEMDTVKPKTKERTGYTWAFVNKLDKKDKKGLQVMSADSDTAATHDMLGQGGVIQPAPKAVSKSGKRVLGPAAPDASTLQAYSAQLHKKDRRDHRKHDSLVASELSGGKATGFERKLEKKAEAKAERQARDGSPDIPGGDPYSGGGTADFAGEVARRNARVVRKKSDKQDAARTKLLEHAEKEKAKMQELLKLAKSTRQENSLYQG